MPASEPPARPSNTGRSPLTIVTTLVAGLTLLGALVIALLPTSYAGTSVVALRPLPNSALAADSMSQIAHEYAVFLGGDSTLQRVAKGEGEASESSVAVVQDPMSSTVRVTVTAKDRSAAVRLANALGSEGESRGGNDKQVRADMILRATDGAVETAPPRKLYLAALLSMALLAVATTAYVTRARGNR
jgi:hypothetical protein